MLRKKSKYKKIIIYKKITVLLTVIVIFLVIVQLVLGGNIGACNKEMALIEEEITKLSKENQFLEEKISLSSSLQVIQEKAMAEGFSTNVSFKDYRFEEPVALR